MSTIESLEVQRVVVEKPGNLADFGLEPPRISVSFKATGDPAPKQLFIGRKTPTGADLYAQVAGQPRVFLISGFLEDSLNKTTFGLRDKTALKLEGDAVDTVTIDVTGSPTLAFVRKGTDWRFTKPWDAKADAATVGGIVSKLATAKMSAIETSDPKADMKTFGLDKPQATVTLGAGSTKAQMVFGTKKADGALYARDLSRPLVFTVDATILDDLKKKPDDLRRKDIFEFRAFSALAITVTIGGKTVTFEKQKGAPAKEPNAAPAPDVWKQTKPEAKDADQTKLTDVLTTMSNLRAEKFADKPQATGEELVLSVKFGDDAASAKTEEVRFRKSGTVVHATLAGEGGAAVVSTTEYDRALALIKELAGVK